MHSETDFLGLCILSVGIENDSEGAGRGAGDDARREASAAEQAGPCRVAGDCIRNGQIILGSVGRLDLIQAVFVEAGVCGITVVQNECRGDESGMELK